MEKNSPINLGVIIISYNSENELVACILAIQKSTKLNKINHSIYVVDNNSIDNSVRVSKDHGASVIANDTNQGFATAVNQGVKKALAGGSNYLLVLNPDVIINEAALPHMLNAFVVNPRIGAVGPAMFDAKGHDSTADYYLKAPSWLSVTLFSTILRPYSLKSKFLIKSIYQEVELNHDRSVEQVPGACLLISKKVWEKVGTFDEDYAIWYEDVDWCYRARKNNYLVWFCSQAKVEHIGGASFKQWQDISKAVTFYVSMKTFFKKHKPLSFPLVVLAISISSLLLYLKSRDKSNLVFLKKFLHQKRGLLPQRD